MKIVRDCINLLRNRVNRELKKSLKNNIMLNILLTVLIIQKKNMGCLGKCDLKEKNTQFNIGGKTINDDVVVATTFNDFFHQNLCIANSYY